MGRPAVVTTRAPPVNITRGRSHRCWLLVLVVPLVAAAVMPQAAGHAVPFDSQPSAGTSLPQSPPEVWVRFTEPLHGDGSFVHVVAADGTRWDAGNRLEGTDTPTIHVTLRNPLPDGAYRLVWQTFSATDGHVVSGSIGFAIGDAAAPASAQTSGVDSLHLAGRILTHLGLAMAATVLWTGLLATPQAARPWRDLGLVLHGAGVVLLAASTWRATGSLAAVTADPVLVARMVLAVGWALPVIRQFDLPAWGLAVVLAAQRGHATGDVIGIALETLHAASAAAWVGGLLALWWALRDDERHAMLRGSRFGSRAAILAAGAVVSGLMLSALLLGPDLLRLNWLTGPWGLALGSKLVAIAVMLLLAWANRRGLRGDWQWRRLVAGEVAAGAVVLLLAGVMLAATPPTMAGSIGQLPDGDAGLHVTGNGRELLAHGWLTPTPANGSFVQVRLQVVHDGQPVANNTCGRETCLQFAWWQEGDDTSRQEAWMTPTGEGWWEADGVLITAAGVHQWEVVAQTSAIYQDRIQGNFTAS